MDERFAFNVARAHTRDVDIALDRLRRLYGGEAKVEASCDSEWRSEVFSLGPMVLVNGSSENAVQGEYSMGRYTILMTRASSISISAPGYDSQRLDTKNAFVGSPGKSVGLRQAPDWRTMNLVIDPIAMRSQLEALTGEPIDGVIDFHSALDLTDGVGAYLQQTCYYLAAQCSGGGKHVPPALVASLCEGLARALLTSHRHTHSYLLEKPAPPSSRSVVRLVEEYIDSSASGPILAADLAKIAGSSMASIEAAFQQHRGIPPMAFLRRRRLEKARAALLADSRLPTSSAAYMAGYLGVEAFEAAYHKQFRESPAETKRLGLLTAGSKSQTSTPETPEVRLARLSAREREVCDLLAKGLLNKQVAAEMGITEKTVQEYRGRAMQKLGLNSVAELARLWERQGK